MDQMAAFLASAIDVTGRMTPSLRVGLFWHAFVLHTARYAAFCAALGTGFIHHVPDRRGHDPAEGRAAMARTRDAIRAAGFAIDPDFWPENAAADCSQSYAGCHGSPVNR
ncbi:hypothetical protein RM780_20785 [Streptomyces sp. DSM 44917]|uniref:Uncharacterized protein n=1 Tax=Streptomyces boetiae TaxID=3075541 RepID=A0ABU2LCR8_9ACTN|nr:hypothetical protein [Streptomyces sp. DSM 44917]MDT0309378.1 hypothetical protein [Streptomyces sp. DSM 44917]